MKILFLEDAQKELDDAVVYYDNELAGLGDQFLVEIINTLNRIMAFPEAWHPYSKRTRRCQAKKFPYAVIYQIRKDCILVVAIAHLHRKPEYWRNRK